MFREKFKQLTSEIKHHSLREKRLIFFAMICSFCITSEYTVTRLASNSIFITHYSAAWLPYAWLATVPLNFLVVSFYNRFLPYLGCFRLFLVTVGLTIGINTLSAFIVKEHAILSFILYIWKDIYILLMFQQLWSVIHSTIKISKAQYLYGIFFGVGGLGSILGSMIPGFFAVKAGSESLLLTTLPIYFIFILAYFFLLKSSRFLDSYRENRALEWDLKNVSHGFGMIWKSRSLTFILLIVVLMQFSTSIADYQFNTFLERRILDQDIRTEFYGKLWGVITSINLFLQFIASFFLIHFLGLRKSHILIPSILLINAMAYLLRPTFALMTYSFGVIKTFDYSIFNIIKEMLYIPLKVGEKFKGKAVIDVFAYRSAKALGSILIVAMQAIYPNHLSKALSWVHIALFLAWITFALILLKEESTQETPLAF